VLFSVLLRILRNEARAQEVLQDVFVQIGSVRQHDPRLGKLPTWAIILARNKAIDQLRSMQREGKVIDLLKGFVEESALSPETVHQEVATHVG
jgi:DNA-directed RNA polymerase specialized sigma24 family protein